MKCDNTSLSNVPIQSSTQSCHRNSIVSSVFGVNKTRRNSLTNSSNNLQTISVHHQKVPMTSSSSVFSTQPSYDCAEDYMTYDPDEQHSQCGGHSLKLGSVGSRVSTCALTRAESRKSTSSVSGLSSFRRKNEFFNCLIFYNKFIIVLFNFSPLQNKHCQIVALAFIMICTHWQKVVSHMLVVSIWK